VLQLGHSILVHTANQIYNNEDCTDSSPDCLVAGRSNEDTLQSTYPFCESSPVTTLLSCAVRRPHGIAYESRISL
jgi:hypothetical protein